WDWRCACFGYYFFFQAEDGIRARNVTGVQTCALPISARSGRVADRAAGGAVGNAPWYTCNPMGFPRLNNDDEPMEFIMTKDKIRSEERRVGKECRYRK